MWFVDDKSITNITHLHAVGQLCIYHRYTSPDKLKFCIIWKNILSKGCKVSIWKSGPKFIGSEIAQIGFSQHISWLPRDWYMKNVCWITIIEEKHENIKKMPQNKWSFSKVFILKKYTVNSKWIWHSISLVSHEFGQIYKSREKEKYFHTFKVAMQGFLLLSRLMQSKHSWTLQEFSNINIATELLPTDAFFQRH